MINIDFPTDPSNLRFHLDRTIATTYLVAKAARHYGASNINVAFISPTPLDIKADERNRSVYQIIDALGLSDVAMMSCQEHVRGRTVTEVMDVFNELLRGVYTAVEADSTLQDTNLTQSIGFTTACLVVTINMHLGRVNSDLTFNTSSDINTYVSPFNNNTGSTAEYLYGILKLLSRPKIADQFKVWSPLQEYTDQDILESAVEEGLLDIMTMVRTCEHIRPMHCGVCDGCVNRRMLFISSGVDDNTMYECR